MVVRNLFGSKPRVYVSKNRQVARDKNLATNGGLHRVLKLASTKSNQTCKLDHDKIQEIATATPTSRTM